MKSTPETTALEIAPRQTPPPLTLSPPLADRDHIVGTKPGGAIQPDVHTWAVIKLDYQMRGQIAVDESGHYYLEGDLSLPKWHQGSACSHALARLIEQVFELEKNDIFCRLRVIQTSGNEVNPQVLLLSKRACTDNNKLTSLISEFAAQISVQTELLDAKPMVRLDETTREKTKETASTFLDAFGGQSVQKQIQFCVGDADIASIRGQWKANQSATARVPLIHNHDAWYDGRRLRNRTLFVVVTKPHVRGLEVNYDDDTFDQQLRDLDDNKKAILKIEVEEKFLEKGKSTLRLLKMSRIVPPEELELLATDGPV